MASWSLKKERGVLQPRKSAHGRKQEQLRSRANQSRFLFTKIEDPRSRKARSGQPTTNNLQQKAKDDLMEIKSSFVLCAWRDSFRTYDWSKALGDPEVCLKEISGLLDLVEK